MLLNVVASAALVGSMSVTGLNSTALDAQTTYNQTPLVQTIGYSESGKKRLKRLLRPHIAPLNITRAARAATGDPNITVIDRRSRWGEVYSCSYLNIRKNQRALVCD